MYLLTSEFTVLVLIANAIALPLSYALMSRLWLRNFACRITPALEGFLLAAVASVIIALLTIGYQAARASQARPVDALRYE